MKQNYNQSLQLVLKDEGGYSNVPGDNGGPTNFGITLADYRKYISRTGTAKDVKNMSLDEAKSIYKSKYWDALSCDSLPSGVDYTCFDYGVNSGLGRPRKALQRFKSLTGTKLIDAINDERVSFLRAIGKGHNAQFMKGWMRRVSGVRAVSKQMATKDHSSGPTAAVATAGAAIASSSFWHNHEYLIIGGGIGLAILVGLGIHYYLNRGKQ